MPLEHDELSDYEVAKYDEPDGLHKEQYDADGPGIGIQIEAPHRVREE